MTRMALTILCGLILVAPLSGCGGKALTAERFYDGIPVGATRDAVIRTAGQPTATFPETDGSTTLEWTDYKTFKANARVGPDGKVATRNYESFKPQ